MEAKTYISRLKAPSKITRTNTILRDITKEKCNNKENVPSRSELASTSSTLKWKATSTLLAKKLPSLKTRRSKSFSHLTTRPMQLLTGDKNIQGAKKPPLQKATTISFGTRPALTSSSSRIAPKRPASDDVRIGTKSTTGASTSASAPKLAKISKFDFKARFNLLETKHKQLLEQHREVQAKLKVSEEKNNEWSNEVREQGEAIKELETNLQRVVVENQRLKVSERGLSRQLDSRKADVASLQRENQVLTNQLESKRGKVAELTDGLHIVQEKYERCSANNKQLNEHLNEALETIDGLKTSVRDLEENRRILHNHVQDMKGTIRVFCRVRPLNEDEIDCKMPCNLNCLDEITLELKGGKEISCMSGKLADTRMEFTYDRVFHEGSSQAEVFEDLAQLVQSTVDGYNVCVFAYGQTGSGKTYTMMGNEEDAGMIPRSIDLLFNRIRCLERCGWMYEVHASFLEIYNETIKDLLNPECSQLHEILHNNGKGSVVTNLRTKAVDSAETLKRLMRKANRNRAVAATNFNLHSSRSHSVTKISVRGYFEQNELLGSLNLVDLAGSETAKISKRMDETKSINKSLSALGNVMLALHNRDPHVPYRNSKLTYLLQSSLGGNSKTLMFVNICPLEECYAETINSLRFAAKVKEVRTGSRRTKVQNKPSCTTKMQAFHNFSVN